jgi:hypothetical protein
MKVVRAGRLIDGTGAEVQQDRAVYLVDKHIHEVGPGRRIASDADVLDLRVRHSAPGSPRCETWAVKAVRRSDCEMQSQRTSSLVRAYWPPTHQSPSPAITVSFAPRPFDATHGGPAFGAMRIPRAHRGGLDWRSLAYRRDPKSDIGTVPKSNTRQCQESRARIALLLSGDRLSGAVTPTNPLKVTRALNK